MPTKVERSVVNQLHVQKNVRKRGSRRWWGTGGFGRWTGGSARESVVEVGRGGEGETGAGRDGGEGFD